MDNKKMFHINLGKEDIEGATYAILPGDPGRVSKIAEFLSDSKFLTSNREYTSYLGSLNNEKVLVISTGIGGPSAAICIEELAQIGIKNIIRVGTCGGMQTEVEAGDIVIASAAIRKEGTSKEYLPIEYPAVASLEITNALVNAAKVLGYPYHVGVIHSKDSFYGQHNPERMPVSYELTNEWQAWLKGGTLASEMEAASLFIVGSTLKLNVGVVLLAIWNQEREKNNLDNKSDFDTSKEISVAIKALEMLINEKK